MEPIVFETHPSRYKHWKLSFDGPVARLAMDVDENAGLRPADYKLKLNSYDLGVDIELADAVQRLRFEHPEIKVVVVSSAKERIFCAGANIFMLGSSSHAFKVNFCKFTNETRLGMEDASANAGLTFLAGVNGICAGGGYELALACDEIVLVEDGSSAVSLPELPLLGVLPGTGGITRLVDKRHVRRDRADAFCTLAEGIKGKRALDWGLVDHLAPKSRFEAVVEERARALAARSDRPGGRGITLSPLGTFQYVKVDIDRARKLATLTVRAPDAPQPESPEGFLDAGDRAWALRAFRELDAAMLDLRLNALEIGTWVLRTEGDPAAVLAADAAIARHQAHWLVREIRHFQKRVLKRLDVSARSLFALVEPESAFAGSLAEILLAADRAFMLDDPDQPAAITLGPANDGLYPMATGLTRLQARWLHDPPRAQELAARGGSFGPREAEAAGLVTFTPDAIDWDDEVRLALEERASYSPDALTGMEANVRFAGPETMETKIFGRLSAWQNWIFTRPSATGEKGALTLYGKAGQRPEFDPRRT